MAVILSGAVTLELPGSICSFPALSSELGTACVPPRRLADFSCARSPRSAGGSTRAYSDADSETVASEPSEALDLEGEEVEEPRFFRLEEEVPAESGEACVDEGNLKSLFFIEGEEAPEAGEV